MDFGLLQAFADTAIDVHNSDHGQRFELFFMTWVIVRRFTKPITAAVQKLSDTQTLNTSLLAKHAEQIGKHEEILVNHEKRIIILETDKTKGE
jgi:hypothetical protein